jgi:hypothetical protein
MRIQDPVWKNSDPGSGMEKCMAETSGGSHELLPHLDDGDEGGAAQRVLRILLILLTNHQLFFL